MTDIALRMNSVYKRFRKGVQYDSLRDLIPALTGRMFRRTDLSSSDDREFWALEDISFSVEKGEAFGIVGHNGAGKSTLLKILAGILQPTRGTLEVTGRLSAILEVSAGFHPDLTGRENIFLNGTILGMTRKEIESNLDAIVDFSGLEEFIDTPVKRYSSGMFARLGFSVCAHVDPDVLVVDEVLSVGDFMFQQKCFNRMYEVMTGGTTVLFVSHNLKAVSELCNRSMLLDHGKAIAIDETDAIIRKYTDIAPSERSNAENLIACITAVLVDGDKFRGQEFEIGQRIRVAVKVRANRPVRNLAIAIGISDEHYYRIFNTSSERLARKSFDLDEGQEITCEFELTLNIAFGLYHFGASIHRYLDGKTIDAVRPAFSFYVGSIRHDYGGIIPADPRLVGDVPGPRAIDVRMSEDHGTA